MQTFKIEVSDTLTIRRTQLFEVEAATPHLAKQKAIALALDGSTPIARDEEQIDATPYEPKIAAA